MDVDRRLKPKAPKANSAHESGPNLHSNYCACRWVLDLTRDRINERQKNNEVHMV